MKRINVLLSIVLLATACQMAPPAEDSVKTIRVELTREPLRYSSVFDDVRYVLLDCPSDSFLIGEVDKMKLAGDELFLVTSRRIVSYNINSGRPVAYLDKRGSAPEEYSSLTDLWVDDNIEILDNNSKCIKRYDRNGNFLSETKIPSHALSFYKTDKDHYLLYSGNILTDENKHRLNRFDAKNQTIEQAFLPIDEHLAKYFFVMELSNFNTVDGSATFFSNPDHISYAIAPNDSLRPQYQIDFGKHAIPASFFEREFDNIAVFSQEAYRNDYIYFVNNWSENSHHSLFTFIAAAGDERKIFLSAYNKRSGKTQTGSWVVDDVKFPGNSHAIPPSYCFVSDNNCFYALLDPDPFIEMTDAYRETLGGQGFRDFLDRNRDIKAILESPGFSDQSNPVLVIGKFAPPAS